MPQRSLAQLLTVPTLADVEARVLGYLNVAGFPITDWESGGAQRTTFRAFSQALLDFAAKLVPQVAAGAHPSLAQGGWLAMTAEQDRDLVKRAASSTVQELTLTCNDGIGPYTSNAGDLIAESTSGNRYIMAESILIPLGQVDGRGVLARFKAESPGSQYADEAGSITKLITPLPGVSVINAQPMFSPVTHLGPGTGTLELGGSPADPRRFVVRISGTGQADTDATFDYSVDDGPFVTGGLCVVATFALLPGGTQLTFVNQTSPSFVEGDEYIFSTPGSPTIVQGQDEESDEELQMRMRARWPNLAEIPLDDTYKLWVHEAAPEITKVTVSPANTAATPGRFDVVVAGTTNPLSGATIAAAQVYLNARRPIGHHPAVSAAVAREVRGYGIVSVPARQVAAVQLKANAAWNAYVHAQPIGGLLRAARLLQVLLDAGIIDFVEVALDVRVSGEVPDVRDVIALGVREVALPSPIGLADAMTWTLV